MAHEGALVLHPRGGGRAYGRGAKSARARAGIVAGASQVEAATTPSIARRTCARTGGPRVVVAERPARSTGDAATGARHPHGAKYARGGRGARRLLHVSGHRVGQVENAPGPGGERCARRRGHANACVSRKRVAPVRLRPTPNVARAETASGPGRQLSRSRGRSRARAYPPMPCRISTAASCGTRPVPRAREQVCERALAGLKR